MPDGIQEISRTGKVSRSELREMQMQASQINRESLSSTEREEEEKAQKASASITGIMPIYREPADDTAERDDDMPAEE